MVAILLKYYWSLYRLS